MSIFRRLAHLRRDVACMSYFTGANSTQEIRRWATPVPNKGGYNEWAETNNIIVLYPQTEAILVNLGLALVLIEVNSGGCWDWWGLDSSLSGNGDFARKGGYQISAIRKMLGRLAGAPVSGGGSSASFEYPKSSRWRIRHRPPWT